MIALVDTIRAAAWPRQLLRMLALQAVMTASANHALFGATSPSQRAAVAVIPIVLGIFGWVLRALHEAARRRVVAMVRFDRAHSLGGRDRDLRAVGVRSA